MFLGCRYVLNCSSLPGLPHALGPVGFGGIDCVAPVLRLWASSVQSVATLENIFLAPHSHAPTPSNTFSKSALNARHDSNRLLTGCTNAAPRRLKPHEKGFGSRDAASLD